MGNLATYNLSELFSCEKFNFIVLLSILRSFHYNFEKSNGNWIFLISILNSASECLFESPARMVFYVIKCLLNPTRPNFWARLLSREAMQWGSYPLAHSPIAEVSLISNVALAFIAKLSQLKYKSITSIVGWKSEARWRTKLYSVPLLWFRWQPFLPSL